MPPWKLLLLFSLVIGFALGNPCSNFTAPSLPDAKILEITSNVMFNLTLPSNLTGIYNPRSIDVCNVTITLTHPDEDDHVFISIWLPPAEQWNRRYAATGGGGLAAGYPHNMFAPVVAGFASSSTDGGLTLNHTVDPQTGLWIRSPDGTINTSLLVNLADRSVHDMAVASKDIIEQYYDAPATKAYYTGCSQGGRQGYAAAAHYPRDFDGILAVAPALSSELIGPANFWPWIVMRQEGELVPPCIFSKFEEAIVEACDPVDGVTDGLISDPGLLKSCEFYSTAIIGEVVDCGEDDPVTITEKHGRIVQKILNGPVDEDGNKLWFGLTLGASFSALAGSVALNGTRIPKPFSPSAGWLHAMLPSNVSDIFNITDEQYLNVFSLSAELGTPIFGLDPSDLTDFHDAGGKLLTWVGLSDEAINPLNLLEFYDSAKQLNDDVNDFYRLFTAPGVGHCKGGTGPQPLNALPALVKWVENGIAPETLPTMSNRLHSRRVAKAATRPLCLYPKKAS
ncbi:Tannase/feruloyl esterase [Aspergillus heterothallicus]